MNKLYRITEICESCNGHGYVRFRNGGDEECFECDGEGMTYEEGDECPRIIGNQEDWVIVKEDE